MNFAALHSLGVTIDDGSFPDAYNAVIANINAHGGVNGRKLVLHTVEMNPAVPADATSSCTQLTEDDKVFVSISPVFPDCYQQDHDTPVIAGSLPGTLPASRPPTSRSYRRTRTLTPSSSPRSTKGCSRARRLPSSTVPTRTNPR